MEFYGVGFLSEKFDETRHRMEVKADYLERRAYRCAKREFEIGSTKDLAYILFEELRLPYPGPSTKGGPSRRSTDKEVLGQLTHLHPLPDVILEYRKLTNAIAKYISPLPKFSYYNEVRFLYHRLAQDHCTALM
jgi:DNA polymerase theta